MQEYECYLSYEKDGHYHLAQVLYTFTYAMEEKRYTLITGASTGIGRALVDECASRGMHLILVSLPNENLASVATKVKEQWKVEALYYETDLAHKASPQQLFDWCKEQQLAVNVLINNAGIGGGGAFEETTYKEDCLMVNVNVQAVMLLTKVFLPELKRHPRAYLMNVGSRAGFHPIPYKSLYAASKSFVYFFTRALREELIDTNVRVSTLCPGAVPTNENVKQRINSLGPKGKFITMESTVLARLAITKMLKGKAVIVPGWSIKVSLLLAKSLPTAIQQKLIARSLKSK